MRDVRQLAPVNVGPGRSAILRPENVACVGICDGCINDLGVARTCQQARDGEPRKDRACHILAPAIAAVLAPVDPAFLRPDIDHVRIGLRDLYRRDRASIQNGRNILPMDPVIPGAPDPQPSGKDGSRILRIEFQKDHPHRLAFAFLGGRRRIDPAARLAKPVDRHVLRSGV